MTCTHPRIITYHDADTGQPVQLWACAECGHRFEPMQQDDTALLRQALKKLEELRVTIDSEWGGCRDLEEIDAAGDQWPVVDALRERLGETE